MIEMPLYHKINSVFKRDQKGQFIFGEWTEPEFEYLADLPWRATEKVDGTNIRVGVTVFPAGGTVAVEYGGRTNNAQIPATLVNRLKLMFETDSMKERLRNQFVTDADDTEPIRVTFYGEGYGAKIQSGGGNYNPNGVDFVVFDIKIDGWWLKPDAVDSICNNVGLDVVPVVSEKLSLRDWIEMMNNPEIGPFESEWGEQVKPEGVVLTPLVPLFSRNGGRIITKLKYKDFE